MKSKSICIGMALFATLLTVHAHFLVLLPDTDLAGQAHRNLQFDIRFTHPMEGGPLMDMTPPVRFGVTLNGKKTDLLDSLVPRKADNTRSYAAAYTVKAPGDHIFYLEPAPYWEPAEGKWIIHYTKVIVNAFGAEDGWDKAIGLPVEIQPLTRPYGLWTGNLFRGIVLHKGKPVPFAEIEVEYWNPDGNVAIPADAFITQVIKCDSQGGFSYALPKAGWWAFAALIDGEKPMASPTGEAAGVELGGLIWVHCTDMLTTKGE